MNDFAVKADGLTKIFPLYNDPVDRLKESLHPFRKKYHRDFYALNNVSLEVKKGQTFGIIGKNGSGKSTLLKMLTGVLTPTEGQVTVNGRVLALLELGAGFNPELTGIENIYFNGALLGASRDELDDKLDDILSFADIGEFAHQPVKSYSSGMYVRLAFAIIAHLDADILVIDEALSVGDAFFTQKCMRFLRRFMEKGTLLFVSHDTGAVIGLCERAIWLNNGQCEFQGTAKETAEKYLAAIYESKQGETAADCGALASESEDKNEVANQNQHAVGKLNDAPRDMRQDFINGTNCRNDIELFHFKPDAGNFGKGGGRITSVQLLDESEKVLSWVVGGEQVKLKVLCDAHVNLTGPIIGFYFNDKLGQPLFGDNTFNFSKQAPLRVRSAQKLEVLFEFRMPVLPAGDYTLTVALAEGTQQEHVQHHWIYDALVLKSHSSSVSTGLIGVPMNAIKMRTL